MRVSPDCRNARSKRLGLGTRVRLRTHNSPAPVTFGAGLLLGAWSAQVGARVGVILPRVAGLRSPRSRGARGVTFTPARRSQVAGGGSGGPA